MHVADGEVNLNGGEGLGRRGRAVSPLHNAGRSHHHHFPAPPKPDVSGGRDAAETTENQNLRPGLPAESLFLKLEGSVAGNGRRTELPAVKRCVVELFRPCLKSLETNRLLAWFRRENGSSKEQVSFSGSQISGSNKTPAMLNGATPDCRRLVEDVEMVAVGAVAKRGRWRLKLHVLG
nr:hypothetical protein Iba_chr01aCG9370 [Ipomoea batatas]